MNSISFMTANYVAREIGFHLTGWMEGQNAVMARFEPIATYAERFAALLDQVRGLGFDTVDLWLPHLHPEWATAEHIAIANKALAARGMKVASLAGGFGETPAEFERCCRVAQAVGTRILGGMSGMVANHRAEMFRLLEQYDCCMAIENHPEKTPAEVLAQIGGDTSGRLGTCVDTGIWANQGYDPLRAVDELRPHILYVHLKDVRVATHESCRYGRGDVPLERIVRKLVDTGYTGGFSVEHEPHDYDPSDDAAASAEMLRGWLD